MLRDRVSISSFKTGLADTTLHLDNFFICELFKLGLALVL